MEVFGAKGGNIAAQTATRAVENNATRYRDALGKPRPSGRGGKEAVFRLTWISE